MDFKWIQVTINNWLVPGAPFRIAASPAAAYLPHSLVECVSFGPHNTCAAGEPQTLRVRCKDRWGNLVVAGGLPVRATPPHTTYS